MSDSPYRSFIAVNAKDASAPWVKTIVDNYLHAHVASTILKVCHGATLLPAWYGSAARLRLVCHEHRALVARHHEPVVNQAQPAPPHAFTVGRPE